MSRTEPSEDKLRELRAGQEAASREVFARYAHRLVAYANRHLAKELHHRADGEDVVQSVFKTFFRRARDGEFQVESSIELWRLLLQITVNKVRATARIIRAKRRNPAREAKPATADRHPLDDVMNREPGAEELAAFENLLREIVAAHTPLHGRVLELRLAGYGPSEIAKQLGVTRQTVHRHLTRLSQWLRDAG